MAAQQMPPQERLRKLLDYSPETGLLVWRELAPADFRQGARGPDTAAKIWNRVNAGRPALSTPKANGYLCGGLDYQQLLQHRVIWKWMTGEEPDNIDHINGNPADNRWQNLRSVSRHINMRNMKKSAANRSGVTGVGFHDGRWVASHTVAGKTRHLGKFGDKESAIAARQRWENGQGFHPAHGKR